MANLKNRSLEIMNTNSANNRSKLNRFKLSFIETCGYYKKVQHVCKI